MLPVIVIGGRSGTGKSALARSFLAALGGDWTEEETGLLRYLRNERRKVIVLGRYRDGDPYPGTDQLSYAFRPGALAALQEWACSPALDGWSVVGEGHRLFFEPFLRALHESHGVGLQVVLLTAGQERLPARRAARGDGPQFDAYLRRLDSKLRNVCSALPPEMLVEWVNETPDDARRCLENLLALAGRNGSAST